MASKKLAIWEWTCDACGQKCHGSETKSIPSGWKEVSAGVVKIGPGEYTQGIDICESCATDPEAAIKKYRAKIGQP